LARIEAAPSPASARQRSTSVSDSNLCRHEEGDTPWCLPGVSLRHQHLAGIGGRPAPSLRR
jgi:hypothetical protein